MPATPPPDTAAPSAPPAGFRRLWALSWPVALEQLLQGGLGFVDSLLVAQLGLGAVAAVGITNNVVQLVLAVLQGFAVAGNVFVARSQAAGQPPARYARPLLRLSGLTGLLCGLGLLLGAGPLLRALGATPTLLAQALPYFRITALSCGFMAWTFTLGALLRGSGAPRLALRVGGWINLLHAGLDYLLLFVWPLGLAGAAWASLLARAASCAWLYGECRRRGLLTAPPAPEPAAGPAPAAELWRFSLPSSLERVGRRVGQLLYFGLILRLGTAPYAAHTLTGNFTLFATVLGAGLASATATLLARQLGAGQPAAGVRASATGAAWRIGALMTATTAALWLLAPWVLPWFTRDAGVQQLIRTVLLIDVVAQPATGAVTAYTAALQARGDARTPMWVTFGGIWGVRVVGVYLLGVHWGWGLPGVWVAIALDNYLRAALLYRA